MTWLFEVGEALLRVQCKWGALDSEGRRASSSESSRCTPRAMCGPATPPDEIDLVAVYCGELDRCYLLPSALAAGRKGDLAALSAPLNGQRACLNLATNFEFRGL